MLAHTSDASNWLDIIARRTEMAFPKMHVFEVLLAGSQKVRDFSVWIAARRMGILHKAVAAWINYNLQIHICMIIA